MAKVIDTHDLPEEEIKLVQKFIDFLREKGKKKGEAGTEKGKINFGAWKLGAKGNFTRKEIYDYL
ncbi:MAG: hypothetical protein FJ115_00190 [Deltaproteobacteria bacterium]|nr:hypothetical protein [Deltaproteobacteria bacterium]MBM4321948.1 hypothetical protein [Deltaproteobacteria bacterium]